jgi:hypothetical protein
MNNVKNTLTRKEIFFGMKAIDKAIKFNEERISSLIHLIAEKNYNDIDKMWMKTEIDELEVNQTILRKLNISLLSETI